MSGNAAPMNSAMIEFWQVGYLCAGLLFACAAIVAGDFFRTDEPPSVSMRCGVAVTTGTLWPVVVVGLLQLWVVERVVRHLRRPAHRSVAALPARELVGSGSRV